MKSVSGKHFCTLLSRSGWNLVRIHGSQHIFRHPDGRTVTIPVHGSRDLKRGLQHYLEKYTGVTIEQQG